MAHIKNGVYRGLHFFSSYFFVSKHRLWILSKVIILCTHNLCFVETIKKFLSENCDFLNFCILHGHVFM